MLAAVLSITYVGAALCYVASPKSAPDTCASIPGTLTPRVFRLTFRLSGIVLMGMGFGLSITREPVGAAVLVWLSMGMVSLALLIIAAPLVNRFVPVTSALALAIAVLALWM